jgi:cytochrome c-type biogenesis protein CcmH
MKRRNLIFLFGAILTVLIALLGAGAAQAQEPQPTPSDNEVNRVAKQMYCPVCENIPLDVCPTTACAEWRELIRLRLSQGWSDEQIKDYFVQQYGDRVLAEPPRRGLNLFIYILPVIAILGGAVVVWRVIASMRAKTPLSSAAAGERSPGAPQAGADDPYLARLEEELKKKE